MRLPKLYASIWLEFALVKSVGHGFERLIMADMIEYYVEDGDDIVLGTGTATITLSEIDERVAAADCLEKKKTKIMASHAVEIEKIDSQIQELRALGQD